MNSNKYDFTRHKSSKYLSEKYGVTFILKSSKEMIPFEDVSISSLKSKINNVDNVNVIKDENDFTVLFQYKNRKYNASSNLPVYHIMNCKTVKQYPGFHLSNSMPVSILVNGVKEKHSLKLCINCKKEIFRIRVLAGFRKNNSDWFDVLSALIDTKSRLNTFRQDGYHSFWEQLSTGYREKIHWRCENHGCRLNLENDHGYLHTHHINGNKENNSASNLEGLCLLCHALEHPDKMVKGMNKFNVSDFIEKYKLNLPASNISKWEKIKNSHNNAPPSTG